VKTRFTIRLVGFGRVRRAVRQFLRFQPMLRAHRPRLAAAALCMLGFIATGLATPWPIQAVVDGVVLGRRDQGALAWFGPLLPDGAVSLLVWCCCAVVALAAARGLFSYGQNLLTASVGHRLVADLRLAIFDRLQALSLTFHGRARTGDLLVRMTGDIAMLREVLVPALLDTTSRVLVLLGMLAFMAVLDPAMTLIPLATIPIVAASSLRFGTRIRTHARKQRRNEGRIATVAGEALASMAIVQAYSRERDIAERFARQNRRSLRAGLRTLRLQESLGRIVEMTLAVASCAVLALGGTRALTGLLSPGELLVFLTYLRGMFKPIQQLVRTTSRVSKAVACGDRVLEVLDCGEEVVDLPGAADAPVFRGEIVFDRVTFGYDSERPVMREVSFRIAPGERVGLVGPSGAGKSTILSLLLRLYVPQQGRILVDGSDVRSFRLDSYRRRIGVVLQEPFLFGESVADNIRHGDPAADDRALRAAAAAAGAAEFVESLPDGYDTVLGERGASLSRGQQQRIALARMVVRNAPLLVFDEPTTGLDHATEVAVARTLARLSEGRTCLWIAHRLEQLMGCDRLLVLENGRLVEQGSPAALMSRGGAFRGLFAGDPA